MIKKIERSVVVSPLLNIAVASPSGPTLKHRTPVVGLGGSRIAGTASLSLSPDRRHLDVQVRLDQPRRATICLRRLAGVEPDEDADGKEDLLFLEIAASEKAGWIPCSADRRFSLERRDSCPLFTDSDAFLAAGICFSTLRAASVKGVHVEAARAGSSSRSPTGYFAERMHSEIMAAERSLTAKAAVKHVELACLYARHLGGHA